MNNFWIYKISIIKISDAVNRSIKKYSISKVSICPLSKWSFLLKIYSVGFRVFYLYWLVWFPVCCWPLISRYKGVPFRCILVIKFIFPMVICYWFVQHLYIFFKFVFDIVILGIVEWRIHVLQFIWIFLLYYAVILVA